MQQIPIPELNEDTAGVLARVERGETFEVTNSGRPVARIVPMSAEMMAEILAFRAPISQVDDTFELDLGLKDHESW